VLPANTPFTCPGFQPAGSFRLQPDKVVKYRTACVYSHDPVFCPAHILPSARRVAAGSIHYCAATQWCMSLAPALSLPVASERPLGKRVGSFYRPVRIGDVIKVRCCVFARPGENRDVSKRCNRARSGMTMTEGVDKQDRKGVACTGLSTQVSMFREN
jgi:hypothetical protein